jgi:fibronectin-binding autotransporter adhesin
MATTFKDLRSQMQTNNANSQFVDAVMQYLSGDGNAPEATTADASTIRSGSVKYSGSLGVTGSLDINQTRGLGIALRITGSNVFSGSISVDSGSLSGGLFIAGGVGTVMQVTGSAGISGGLTITAINKQQAMTVSGSASFSGALSILAVGIGMTVSGSASFSGGLYIAGGVGTNFILSGGQEMSGSLLCASGSISGGLFIAGGVGTVMQVSGSSSISGALYIAGGAGTNLIVSGSSSISGNLQINAGTLVVGGTSVLVCSASWGPSTSWTTAGRYDTGSILWSVDVVTGSGSLFLYAPNASGNLWKITGTRNG